MAFGRRKPKDEPADESGVAEVPKASATPAERERPVENGVAGDPEGPFDIEDFDDAAAAEAGRLDLGSVLLPMPESAQLQVELTETGIPSAIWVVTANGRFTIAAYAAFARPGEIPAATSRTGVPADTSRVDPSGSVIVT